MIHAAPADQPSSVHQIVERLFPAYTVDFGNVHLAGCRLEDRLFVRLDFRHGDQPLAVYLGPDGGELRRDRVDALGMTEVAQLEKPPQPFEPQLRQLVETGVRAATERCGDGRPLQLLTTTVLWCKFAEGKLRFAVGDHTADLPFADWARTLQPPPFVCPYTSASTFHVAATDDGRVVAAEQIDVCSETGRRVLVGELITCSATGRRAVAELMETCPVSEERVLRREMVACSTCRQPVSPTAIRRNQCAACRNLQPVSKADPRMARALDEHPPLDRWRNWRISETAKVYVLMATGWLRRLLVVVDKDSLDLKLLATGGRLFSGWHVVEPPQYDYVLRE
ncbi:MAG: hypothetical protein JXB62_12410 [Pirellulales bacterium]|nr:hypothetical protein [Pirellulales bacterium]